MKLTKDSLVLYKQTPAMVQSVRDKIDIILPGGKTKSVRAKDIVLLHQGPVTGFPDLEASAPEGQPEEAWELLQGETPSLKELAELVYGEHTPASSWMTFKLLNRSPWFRGSPDAIEIANPESVKVRLKADREKVDAEKKWDNFLERFNEGDIDRTGDEIFLRDLEMYALGRSKGSRILKAIGKIQSPENAHRLMLAKGVKKPEWNLHPLRLNVPLDIPDYPVGDFTPGEKRLDLTQTRAFAIDDEGNQDPDDAIAWDGETFWVHVADVAGIIPSGSRLDEAAMERASSLYLPETTVPMLPRAAAEKLGLGIHTTSPALSYAFEFSGIAHNQTITDGSGIKIKSFSIHLATVQVSRLSYAEADRRMDEEPFITMKKITDAFRETRKAGGSVSINMPEVKLRVNQEGEINITPMHESASREMVAESMLMAGAHAAQWCRERRLPIPFAVQDGPDEKNGQQADKNDYVAQFNLVKGMKRSRTTLECSPHAGLGLEAYTRVTSPLRRYPDLLTSRQIRNTILGREIQDEDSLLTGLAAFESRIGSLIQAERRSNMFWKLQWLKRRSGWKGQAVLVGSRERQGLFLIPEIAMEARVSLKKNVHPGGRVILKVKEVDIPESSVLFIIQEVLE